MSAGRCPTAGTTPAWRRHCFQLRTRAIEGDPFPPPRDVLSDADPEYGIARNLEGVLDGGFRQTAVIACLHVPGEFPAEMLGVLHLRLFA
jgi:hypothetical protein